MTSKEALEKLLEMAIENGLWKSGLVEDIENIILQDLEVLDILKNESDSKRIIERDGIVSFHLDMILTTDNYNKIKEWLEDEN